MPPTLTVPTLAGTPAPTATPVIRVDGLRYRYPGSSTLAVKGLSFSIAEGEIFGFLGPSGAGKSTTQKILIGLLKGYEGEVNVFGRPLAELGKSYYEHIGVGFELPNHYLKLTGLENLSYFRSLYAGDTEEPMTLLEKVGLEDAAYLPVRKYSKGMQSRLSFARALLNRPRLLFLDEPTSGLDPTNARRVKDVILEHRAAGTTVFLTTHNMASADELCDRVAFMVDGEVAALDTPKNLKLQYGDRRVRLEYGDGESQTFPLDGLGDNAGFLELLRRESVRSLHSQEATLESIFIRVTGRQLS